MRTPTSSSSAIGFARYNGGEGVDPNKIIEACLTWREEFLMKQDGIFGHYFFGNMQGQFADMTFAKDQKNLDQMSEGFMAAPSSKAFLEKLAPETVSLIRCDILKDKFIPPEHFACLEFGTFSTVTNHPFSEKQMLCASDKIENEYLSRFEGARGHFMGKVSDKTYAEISFVDTLANARQICGGYLSDPACLPLLSMFDPASVNLDFWYLLA